MKWQFGRQNLYYQKLKIFSFSRLDCYLIRYSPGLAIGYHKDTVEGRKHFRLNIHLIGKNRLCCLDNLKNFGQMSRVCLFRADRIHSYGPTCEKGLILNIGLSI